MTDKIISLTPVQQNEKKEYLSFKQKHKEAKIQGLSASGANLITCFLYPLELLKFRMQSKLYSI